jgi:hypothetical protein
MVSSAENSKDLASYRKTRGAFAISNRPVSGRAIAGAKAALNTDGQKMMLRVLQNLTRACFSRPRTTTAHAMPRLRGLGLSRFACSNYHPPIRPKKRAFGLNSMIEVIESALIAISAVIWMRR